MQKQVYVCVDEENNKHLDEHNCETPPPPKRLPTTCQLSRCPPRCGSHSTLFYFLCCSAIKRLDMNNWLLCSWDTGAFGPCSASCGGGERVRPVRCVQRHGAAVMKVSDTECPPDTAPDAGEKCNLQRCPARYQRYTVLLIITGKKVFLKKEIYNCVCLQMASVRAWEVCGSVRPRRSKTQCVMCPARRWPRCWSGWNVLFPGDQTDWLCVLCGGCLSHWMAI